MDPNLSAFLASYYALRPVNATFTGVHEHDGRLPDWSDAGLAGAMEEMQGVRAGLSPTSRPSTLAEADVAVADGFLEIQIAEMESAHFQRGNPALWTGEAIFGLIGLMVRDFAPAAERADALASRLRSIPAFLHAATQTVAAVAPERWRARATTECATADRLLTMSLPAWARANGLESWLGDVAKPIGSARESFAVFARQIVRDLGDTLSGSCGEWFYTLLLQRGHWCDESVAHLRARALATIDEARATLDRMLSDRGATWASVRDDLARRHPAPNEYLTRFREGWEACRESATQHDLLTWPDFPLVYTPIPPWARSVAPDLYFLFYRSPAPFDATPPEYLVPPIDHLDGDALASALSATNDYVIKTNHVAHHGAIGHHVQNARAYAGPSVIGKIAAVDCASRIGMFAGGSLAEGWACYATDVMDEVGFLTDLERIAHQHGQIRQLQRALIDIDVHVNGMSLDEAVTRFAEEAGVSRPAAEREITRLSMFPGTAVMYWLGTSTIHDLRAEMRERQGSRFALRDFHDRFLGHGALPARLIAHLMSEAT